MKDADSDRRGNSVRARAVGIAAALGVNEDAFLCLSAGEPWLEHGIVEHRYKELCPTAYRAMIDRWGHVIQGPRRYSVTAFLTGTWARLAARGLLVMHLGPATGLYQHTTSTKILYWAPPPGPNRKGTRTWADFAAEHGISAHDRSLPR